MNLDYALTFGKEKLDVDWYSIYVAYPDAFKEFVRYDFDKDLVKYLKYKKTLVSYEKIDDVWWKFINTFEYKDCVMEHHCLSYDSLSLAIKRSIENMFQEWNKKINEKKG